MSNLQILVDGAPVDASKATSYRGLMFSGIPNLALSFGYTNASWTLRSDLIAQYVCRLLNYMRANRYDQCRPRLPEDVGPRQPFVDFSAGYITRGVGRFPDQGSQAPWKVRQNYLLDRLSLRWARFTGGDLELSSVADAASTGAGAREAT
jgi:hypothetical protein